MLSEDQAQCCGLPVSHMVMSAASGAWPLVLTKWTLLCVQPLIDLDEEYPEGTLCWLETPVNPYGESRDIQFCASLPLS